MAKNSKDKNENGHYQSVNLSFILITASRKLHE